MRLAALCDDRLRLRGPGEVEIAGLALDSRTVKAGDLFAALPGSHADGARFVAQARAAGAVAVLGDDRVAAATDLPALIATEPWAALARVAARFFGRQFFNDAAATGIYTHSLLDALTI